MAKSKKSVCKKVVAESFDSVTFSFTNGSTLVCKVADLPEEIVAQTICAGISHTVGDTYTTATTVADAYDKAKARWDAMCDGDWSVGRENGTGLLAAAFAEVKNISPEDARRIVRGLSDEKRKLLLGVREIIEAMAEIRLARARKAAAAASPDVSIDDILS